MPNHVSNVIKMKGIGQLPLFSIDEEGNEYFDFDKIIPMPKSLDIVSGSVTDESIVFFVTEHCKVSMEELNKGKAVLLQMLVHNSFDGNWVQTVFDRVSEEIKSKTVEEQNEMYEMGRQYVDNYLNYGATDWYEWRCENWGTKWNSYEFFREDNDTITFWTAWSCPEPIIKKLAERYPRRRNRALLG